MSSLERYREESGITVHWRQFVLDEFVSSDITEDFLSKIRADLDTIRTAKFTAVMRIMYTKYMPEVIVQFIVYLSEIIIFLREIILLLSDSIILLSEITTICHR